MKPRFLFPVMLVAIMAASQTVLSGEPYTITFTTLGNCYICKTRIETKVNQVEGVISSEWDYVSKVTTVTYDNGVTDAFQVMHAIADTGHDTEWFRAPDSMYALLIGSCCEYPRTIDYTNVQIGYLSLMGIWVYPLGVQEDRHTTSFTVYPTAGNGLIHLRKPLDNKLVPVSISVYSMTGDLVWSDTRNVDVDATIDLTALSKGQYIVMTRNGNMVISKHQIFII
ncbi:MAG: T9SS type A sorting domain-containing protein [bacterium]